MLRDYKSICYLIVIHFNVLQLKLESPLKFNEYVQKVKLPEQGKDVDGETVLAGWGSTGGIIIPNMPTWLQMLPLPIVPYKQCDEALTSLVGPSPLARTNICTGPLDGGKSACSGDSGGPLVKETSNGVEQVGIVSWGIVPCGSVGAPSVYTGVSHFVDWVKETMKNN